jgi:isobutyryl-CoA dehydrogenase
MIGREGQGFSIAMAALDGGRINIASCSIGGAQFCLDAAQEYVSSRKQVGHTVLVPLDSNCGRNVSPIPN